MTRLFKSIFLSLIGLLVVGQSFATVILEVDTVALTSGSGAYQFTTPKFTMIIRNTGTTPAVLTTPLPIGFISCGVWGANVFQSQPIDNLTINPASQLQFSIDVTQQATANLGENTITCSLWSYAGWNIPIPSGTTTYTVIERSGWRFDTILDTIREPLSNRIDGPVLTTGTAGIQEFVRRLIDRFAVRFAVFVGVLFALLALFKMMFSDSDEGIKPVKWLLIWGIVGIIIILSAKFIGNVFYNDIMGTGELNDFSAIELVSRTYDLILRPILKIAFYIMMSVLFVILLIRVFSFITSDEEEIRKKSGTIILNATLWLLIMISSKQLVEWVYGQEESIRDNATVTVSQIGSSFLSTANIPIIYQIIQWVMGLSAFILLAIIVFQTYKMLINPTDEENLTTIRKTLLYAMLGIVVIGAGYLIVNVVMVN